jgi:hypothetical protein
MISVEGGGAWIYPREREPERPRTSAGPSQRERLSELRRRRRAERLADVLRQLRSLWRGASDEQKACFLAEHGLRPDSDAQPTAVDP